MTILKAKNGRSVMNKRWQESNAFFFGLFWLVSAAQATEVTDVRVESR